MAVAGAGGWQHSPCPAWQEQGTGTSTSIPLPVNLLAHKVEKDLFRKKKKKKSSIRSWLKNNKSVVKCG